MNQERQDFEDKVNNQRYKTAELVNGNGFISIHWSYVIDGVAVFWGRYNGVHAGIEMSAEEKAALEASKPLPDAATDGSMKKTVNSGSNELNIEL